MSHIPEGGIGLPGPHKTSHENGGADEISVTGLSGLLGDPQTPLAHNTSHENGGSDEISVLGLSGLLADPQTPLAHTHSESDVTGLVADLAATMAEARRIHAPLALDGTPGPMGFPGQAGKDGAAGINGVPGRDGVPGMDGREGPMGFSIVGPAGARGIDGVIGRDGAPGLDGARGPEGLPGPAGVAGAPGAAGVSGSAGAAGPPGSDGATGPWGLPGSQGVAGATGATGAQGATGAAGIGVPGFDGQQGAMGLPGPPGATGPQGPAGGGGGSATTIEVNVGTTPVFAGKFTITDAAISGTSKVLCWQAPGPYTGKGSLSDAAAMEPVQVIAVAPAAGSAVVHWQTPPTVVMVPEQQVGNGNVVGATFDRLDNQRWPTAFQPRRIGRVWKNIKFSYVVFA